MTGLIFYLVVAVPVGLVVQRGTEHNLADALVAAIFWPLLLGVMIGEWCNQSVRIQWEGDAE